MGVPVFAFLGPRDALWHWAEIIGDSGIKEFWQDHNHVSFGGKSTIFLNRRAGNAAGRLPRPWAKR
jgi:hypothetical protein